MLAYRLRPKQAPLVHLLAGGVACLLVVLVCFYALARPSSAPPPAPVATTTTASEVEAKPAPVHRTDVLVKASQFANPALKKPLELVGSSEVSCPERGGKNTQCGKVFAEYRFEGATPGSDYYLYIQVKAPSLNDNSLWVSQVDAPSAFYKDSACSGATTMGDLVPHKHRSSDNALLCCPKYLAKNGKKGLVGFYSDCCYKGLGKEPDSDTGCVLDLEVEAGPKWNQFPRPLTPNAQGHLAVRIYAREDGTSWTALVVSSEPALTQLALSKLKRAK